MNQREDMIQWKETEKEEIMIRGEKIVRESEDLGQDLIGNMTRMTEEESEKLYN